MAEPAFWTDLQQRGIIHQATSTTLGSWLADRFGKPDSPFHGYCGFDPTADSLHIGSLMPVMGLRRLRQAGMTPIAVVGGATGMIGDPSGKAAERTLLDADALAANTQGLARQLEHLLEGEVGKDFLLVNNLDWFGGMGYIDFLRDIGKHFSVNMMVHKESVRARLEDRDQGISYTEFSYMLLQAYDYLYLYEKYKCCLQVGGSDQWGNITAGIDLIHHKHHGVEVHGATFPLITTSSGQKFGKSERGNIWLDARKTHPYFLYKFLFDTMDADVGRFLRYFTFLPIEEIVALDHQTATAPQLGAGQKALAREVTAVVHGRGIALSCEQLERAMHEVDADAFEKHARELGLMDRHALDQAVGGSQVLPVVHRPLTELVGEGIHAAELAVELGLFKSKSEVRREVTGPNSGFYIGNEQIKDPDYRVTSTLLGDRRVLQVRKGKKNKRMVCFYE